jgi:hypothetical protein
VAFQFDKAAGDIDKQREAVQKLKTAFDLLDLLGIGRGLTDIFGEGNALTNFLFSGGEAQAALVDVAARVAVAGSTADEQRAIWENLGLTVDDTSVSLGLISVSIDEINEALEAFGVADADRKFFGLGEATEVVNEEMEKLREQVEAIRFKELLDNVGLTTDEFKKLALEAGGTEEALRLVGIQAFAIPQALQELTNAIGEVSDKYNEFLLEKAELFVDFQADLTDISASQVEQRLDLESTFEERRTDVVEREGQRRLRDEQDFNRRRARQDAKLASDIEDVNQDAADRALELRADTDRRLQDLERDHLDRVGDIIRDADLALEDAAGRLDAAAVVAITRQREAALKDEREDYAEQREEISRELEVRLEEERRAAQERIQKLQEFHTERQRIEDEDRAIRLARQEEDHLAQLAALDDQHTQRLNQIMLDAAAERMVREEQYGLDRTALENNLGDRSEQQQQWMDDILEAERAWWEDRMALIPGGTGGAAAGGINIAPGAITIPVTAGAGQSPAAVAENVGEVLENIFGMFQ